jgi:acyl-CoA synthetase (NDP forming)
LFSKVLPALAADSAVEALLVGIPVSGEGYDFPRFARDARDFVDRLEIPLVAAIPQPKVRAAFAELGIPCFPTDEEAVAALGRFMRHHEQVTATLSREAFVPKPYADRPSHVLDEANSLTMLEAFGIRGVRRQLCSNPEEALEFFRDAGGAVILKACSVEIPHKSDHGLVRTDLASEQDVLCAYDDIAARVRAGGWQSSGILISDMVRGEREIVIGGHIDPHFGPVVMVGDGGELVEAMPDNILLLPPFTREEVDEQLRRLRLAPMFEEIRGRVRMDRNSLVDAVMAAGAVMRTGRIRSLDMNPLIADGAGLVAVDALVEEYEG